MCGIVGYIGDKAPLPIILEGLKRLEYRGYDSAGVAVLTAEGVSAVRRASGKLRNLEEAVRERPMEGVYGIGHTRWATHGRPSEENAHPHRRLSKGDIVVVHNGIVENYLVLKQELQAAGHVFLTETDTEVIAHLVERNYKGNLEEAVRTAIASGFDRRVRARRNFALRPQARSSVRAMVRRSLSAWVKRSIFSRATCRRILNHTRDMIFLDDGDMAVITTERRAADGLFDGNPIKRPCSTFCGTRSWRKRAATSTSCSRKSMSSRAPFAIPCSAA